MSEWLISRDMNMTRANVVGNLLHPENWGKKKNPAATPSALADWGFVVGRDPSPLGETLVTGALSWQEACILSLAKRGPGDGDAPVKPFVAMMKVLAVLQGKSGAKLKLTARGFTRLSAIASYADITDEFCLGINDPDKAGEPALSNYRDIWLNALTESGLFIRNDDDYELIVSDTVIAFVLQVAKFGEKISPCPSKRTNSEAYYAYMGAVETGLPEIFDLMDSNVIWSVFPHFQKIGTAHRAKVQEKVLQLITYGAPGTGKSHVTRQEVAGHLWYRTTFHPDSDYASFVGTYKPMMKEDGVALTEVTLTDAAGQPAGKEVHDQRKGIAYDFVDQVFTKAYVEAWKLQKKTAEGATPEPVFLVIEEINRGNCAQIFGDIFQLLDRNAKGFSEYSIMPDSDLGRFIGREIAKEPATFNAARADMIQSLYPDATFKVVEDVLAGKRLLLPDNLYIRATMNTSDQSLFPMDSAFKRRWDWKYVPICEGLDKDTKQPLGWKIKLSDGEVDWWKFLVAINKVVKGVTNSADKQMGYFFVRAKDSVIDAEMFVNKVAFYLWNDVFKDCELDGEAFKITREGGEVDVLAFQDFFKEDGSINEEVLKNFLTTLVPPPEAAPAESGAEPAAGDGV